MKLTVFKYQLLLSFCLFQTLASGQTAIDYKDLKLDEAIQIGLAQNKKLQLQQTKYKVLELKERDLKNEKLPEIDYLSSFHVLDNIHQFENGITEPSTKYITPRVQYKFKLTAEVPIYLGGKLKYEEEKAAVETNIQNLRTQKEARQVKLEIITTYLQGLHLKEQQKLIADKIKEDSAVIDQSQKLKQNGVVTTNDVLRTQLLLSNHQMMYSEIETELHILEHQIKTILALAPEIEVHINTDNLFKENIPFSSTEDLLHTAMKQNESFLITEREIKLKELDKKLVKAGARPQITAGAHYAYEYPNFMFFPPTAFLYRFGAIGVNLRIPLSNLYKNKVRLQMADAAIHMAHLEVEEKEEDLRHEVYAAKNRLQEATKKIEIAKLAIAQAAENYRIVRLKYSNQLSLITELIDADNAYLEAQSNLITLTVNQQLKYYQLQYILGNI